MAEVKSSSASVWAERGFGLYGMRDYDSHRTVSRTTSPVGRLLHRFRIGPMDDRTGPLQYCGVLALISDQQD
jgi:hypothetical protein